MFPRFEWNWQEFCGSNNFTIWVDNHQDLSYCFQLLCLQIPILSIIAIVSAYYAGKHCEIFFRTSREKRILKFRMCMVLLLACTPAAQIIILVWNNIKSLYVIDYGFALLASFSWFVHFGYVSAMRNGMSISLRGPVKLISLWIMLFIASIIHMRSMILKSQNDTSMEAQVTLTCSIVAVVLQILYGFSLVFGNNSVSRSSTIDQDIMRSSGYVRFREDLDRHYLGTAMEDAGILSKFFFFWVYDLIDKGAKNQIRKPIELYGLPPELAERVSYVRRATHDNKSLLRILHREFAVEFYCIGILKLVSDLGSLATPLLLHEFLRFIEDPKNTHMEEGYFYAGGILLASMIGSFCIVHFDFRVGKINMKLQSTIMSLLYQEVLDMDSVLMTGTDLGKVVNLMSVDADRIANSCSSIHALWSLPFQLGVTLFLLSTQVGLASLCGVVCSILLIPVNKFIARKIGEFSARMMEEKDKRIGLMSEFLRGMQQIKSYVWEDYFVSRILGVRKEEVRYLKYRKYLDALCVYFWATTPVMISTLTFTVYIYRGGDLNAPVVFTSLSLLNMLLMPLNAFPWILNSFVEAWVSIKRVDEFLQFAGNYQKEKDHQEGQKSRPQCDDEKTDDTAILITKDYFTNLSEKSIASQALCEGILVKKGQLIGISGPVGSGKSRLLYSILGEIEGGQYIWKNIDQEGIGFVSQTPWIQQRSVRDNILFGLPYDDRRYESVIEACALMEDMKLWSKGDAEMVGESGCTLSGGQKARIALARAVYRDANIYLLDDILSAVDREVACHIFQKCILKLLAGKTRIMVTHLNEPFLSFDWSIEMNEGNIVKQGPGKSLQGESSPIQSRTPSPITEIPRDIFSIASSSSEGSNSESTNDLEMEVSATGVVKLGIYYRYWKSVGHALAILILVSMLGMQVTRIAVDWWLSIWVSVKTDIHPNVTDLYYVTWFEKGFLPDDLYASIDYKYFLFVYMSIGTINAVIVIIRSFSFAYGGIRAAIKIHTKLLRKISVATMSFFHSSPLGRILNRFSSDTYTVDDELPFDLNILLSQFVGLLGILATTIYGFPWLCLFIGPLVPVYYWLQNQYRMTSRELKRIFSTSRSLIYSHINETISGLTTIRAFRDTHRFQHENEMNVMHLLMCQLSTIATQAWLNMRLQLIGVCIIGVVCVFAVLQRHFDVAHAGFIGLVITYALTLTGSLEGTLGIFVETERKMVALERVDEYIKEVKTELWKDDPRNRVVLPYAWPSQGVVSFETVSLRYRGGRSYSLKDVTFETLGGEKIGIVGRTGSGKSSLFSTLFRLADICTGRISIDTIDIRDVPLKKLRSEMTIIPQDPFIFSGTLRDNLDPLKYRSEYQVWDTVNKIGLQSLITKIGGIHAEISDATTSLSVGERQLICLMRAILKNSKVVCIDEATANVDLETDKRIRDVIKNAFICSTVLIIAHRVETVMDCDRVLVMGEGEVLEFDSPKTLLEKENSHFYKLVNQEVHS